LVKMNNNKGIDFIGIFVFFAPVDSIFEKYFLSVLRYSQTLLKILQASGSESDN
jgi:hypothetical protein